MSADAGADLALIVEAARAAGALALAMRADGVSLTLKDGGSPVTDADLAADALLKDRLRTARPDYGWLSEETADDLARLGAKRLFIVDPIDGTSAFTRGEPWWSISVAVVEAGRPIAGVVFAPQRDETYAAMAGGGATLNGAAIHASGVSAVAGCRVLGDTKMFQRHAWAIPWPDLSIEWRSSTAYRMCFVASGEADAAIAFVPKHDWDLAAADLIATEAGSYVGDHTGQGFVYNRAVPVQPSLVCVAPGLAPLILERVRHIAIEERTAP